MFGELADLLTAFDMLTEESAVMRQANLDAGKVVVETRKAKRAKIEKFMLYSIERGTLEKRYNARHERIGPGLGLEPEVLISQSALPR
jgi:hypothetical protein